MKKDWTYKKLGEFIEEYSVRDKGQGFPVYSVTNTRGFCQEFFGKNVASDDTSNYKVVPRGCFAYNPSRINVGSVAWQNQEDNVSVSPLYVVFSVSPELRQDYLLYYIKSNYAMTFINALSRGAVRNNLRLSTLKTFDIPYASPSEQKNVVAELDLLSGMIEKQKAQIEELDKLSQSIFYDMFDGQEWEVKTIKDIAFVKIGPFGSALHQHDYIIGGTPLVNPIHMSNEKIIVDNDFTISDEKKLELSAYLLKTNDVVFGRRGDIGRCALVTEKENGYLCGTGSLLVRFSIPINPLYSIKVLSSPRVKQYLLDNARGATMLNLNSKVIEGINIPLPPLSLQQEFAAKIEAIEAMKAKVRQSLKEAETLFNSRMDYYFN